METKTPPSPSTTIPNPSPSLPSLSSNGSNDSNYSADYDYDYDLTDYAVPLEELVPVSLVYGTTLVLGLAGNLLVIVVVAKYRSMKNITNTFLLGLASSDLLLVCICIPVKFAAFFSFSWTFGEFLCRAVSYLQNVSALCSVLTLTAMSLERYYAILHPMRAKYVCTVGRARRAIVLLWITSSVLAVPIIFQTVHMEVGHRRRAYWCVKNWEDTVHAQLYEVYMLWVMLLLPLSVMTFAYASICKELWVMSSLRSTMATRGQNNGIEQRESFTESFRAPSRSFLNGSSGNPGKGGQTRFTFRSSQQAPPSPQSGSPYRAHSERSPVIRVVRKNKMPTEDERTRKQVIKMLVAVIAIFVLCWAPLLVSNVLTAFHLLHHLNYGYLKPLRQAFYLMAYANSCLNPIIYGFMSRHFRQTFVHAICSCLRGRRQSRHLLSSLQRQNSCVTTSAGVGGGGGGGLLCGGGGGGGGMRVELAYYTSSKAGSELELTTLDVSCATCVSQAV